MEQKSNYSTTQKALTFVMAVMVLVLAIFIPVSRNNIKEGISQNKEYFVAHATFQGIPAFPSVTNPPLKLSPFLFDLPNLWLLLLLMAAPGIQQCQTFLSPTFIQKINFIFVSTQAP